MCVYGLDWAGSGQGQVAGACECGEEPLGWAGSGQGQVADACECGEEPSGSIKRVEFLDQLQTSQLLKKDPAPWSK